MRKAIFILLAAMFPMFADAQPFTIPHDTVKAVVSSSEKMHNDMSTTSTFPISVTWQVVAHDFPDDWVSGFAICDNITCYFNGNGILMGTNGAAGQPFTTDTFSKGKTATFYVLPDVSNGPDGTHYAKIEMLSGTYTKSSWYIVTKWPTGVSSVTRNDNGFLIYPNPATNEVTVLHDQKVGIKTVRLYSSLGAEVGRYEAGENATKINMSALSSGLYHIKLSDGRGQTVGVLKVDHR